MLEDRRLIQQLKRGDKDALRRVYEKYKDTMLTVAASLLHDPSAAEDVLHDVFVSFAAGIGHLTIRGSLKRYLITSVVNRVRDRFRKRSGHGTDLEQVDAVAPSSDDPGAAAIFSEQAQRLADALARIPLEQRETIVLHLNAGMKFKEIAEAQGVSVSTVQGRYRYGLDKLRTILDGEYNK